MNHIRSLFIVIIACFTLQHTCLCEEMIIVSFSPYPEPEKTALQPIDSLLQQNIITGICASWWGYMGSSNVDGMIKFPRRLEKASIQILITEKIAPVAMINNTIHHWEIEPGTPATLYKIDRKVDPVANLFYWDTQEAPLPENNRIALDTIIIFTHPKNIYVPIGITPTKDRPNLLLPVMYVKNRINQIPESLYVLNIRYLFGPINSIYKTTPTSYIELLRP